MSKRSATRVSVLVCAIVAIGATVYLSISMWRGSEERLLKQAELEYEASHYQRAAELCDEILAEHGASNSALNLAAKSAQRLGQVARVVEYLGRIEGDDPMQAATRLLHCGRLCLDLGRIGDAERFLRKSVMMSRLDVEAEERLAFVLRIEGRNWEAQEFIADLVKREKFTADHLYVLASSELVWLDQRESEFLRYCQKQEPAETLTLLSLSRKLLLAGSDTEALPLLKKIVAQHPDFLEAQARLGAAILGNPDSNDTARQMLEWRENLPNGAEDYPEIAATLGSWYVHSGKTRDGISHFARVVARAPNHREANYQLSQLLARIGETELAELFGTRAQFLARIEYLVREVQHTPDSRRELCEAMEKLGRPWEAAGWLQGLDGKNVDAAWAKEMSNRLAATLALNPPLNVINSKLSAALHRLSVLPADRDETERSRRSVAVEPRTIRDDRITFEDATPTTGVHFQFDNGADPKKQRAYMFEFSGGGIAVIDADIDGWPDLYLTQGGRWPVTGSTPESIDRCFRNLANGRFAETTQASRLGDDRFSQGVTVGDFDNDGFPDLYVLNIGENRFYHNQGDGTFVDVTEPTGTAGNEWSLSAALADVNGDSLPDLYVVNYLGGDDIFRRECQHHGKPVQCYPTSFPAEQDRLYLNMGDGSFRDITDDSGINVADGKGMGLVVAKLNGAKSPSIYIANDTTSNFLFVNESNEPGAMPKFVDRGVISGVALDEKGQAQSSMGVAIGDANSDGLFDLFVTNYLRETNNLYIQLPDHTFRDESNQRGLRGPTWNMLKWGTQFVDADLDGYLDLVVANGHLDDYSEDGVPYKMRTQVFHNDGGGRFHESPSQQLGDYFCQQVLGRSVARWDWNRDGRDDLCITHVDSPCVTLINKTPNSGHGLSLLLVGTESSRDAIGAIVHVRTVDKMLVHQLTAGDGFEASNERKLNIGLGTANQAESVIVDWPNGKKQEFHNLTADTEWLIVEGWQQPLHRQR